MEDTPLEIRAKWKKFKNEERAKIKAMDWPTRREYIWDYYKFHIAGVIVAIFLIGSFVNHRWINPPKDTILHVAWVADAPIRPVTFEYLSDILTYALADDLERYVAFAFDYSVTGDAELDIAIQSRFAALIGSSEMDIFIGSAFEVDRLHQIGGFHDIIPFLERAGLPLDSVLFLPNMHGVDVPVAISLEGTALLEHLGVSSYDRYMAVFINTAREEMAVAGLRVLWGYYE